jgi:hypothetical protein
MFGPKSDGKRPKHAQRIQTGRYLVVIGISTPVWPEKCDVNRPVEGQQVPNAVTFLVYATEMDIYRTTLTTATGIYPYHQLLSQSSNCGTYSYLIITMMPREKHQQSFSLAVPSIPPRCTVR